jgi:hypothetical protein
MRSRAFSALSLVIACDLCLLSSASLAQQTAPTSSRSSPPRLGYYTRVQSLSAAGSSARNAANNDPLRPYGSDSPSGAGTASRPYERAPVVSPPERETPAPAVSHNYFPGTRTGQSSNRNVVPHCVPGRHGMMHR